MNGRQNILMINAEELHEELVIASIKRGGGIAKTGDITLEDCEEALIHLSKHNSPPAREIDRDLRIQQNDKMSGQ